MSPPLAGKPPYATDDLDSVFETQPQRRLRQPAPEDPNKRTSAYDVYDNYLTDKALPAPANTARNSGIGNLLLNMGDDSDDSDDDDGGERRKLPKSLPGVTNNNNNNRQQQQPPPVPSKTAALAAAVNAPPRGSSKQPVVQQQHQPIPRQGAVGVGGGPPPPLRPQQQPQIKPIAAPRPGYPAPIAALNGQASDAIGNPKGMAPPGPGPVNRNPEPSPHQQGPRIAFARPPPGPLAPSARPMADPHPLQPPLTPITPAFIRPSSVSPAPTRSNSDSSTTTLVTNAGSPGVKFADRPTPILRGNREETLLPSRGEKGDDFWRRFSIVAKEPSSRNESSWLKKMRNRSNQLSRYVWIVGIIIFLLAAGGVGLGVYFSRSTPSHQQPKAIGGSDDHFATGTTTTTKTTTGAAKTGAPGATSIKHISPTNTIAKREADPEPTSFVARHLSRKRRMQVW